MNAQSFFEQNGGTYMQVGDYYIPDLKDEEPGHYSIGKYGRMRRRYLQAHQAVLPLLSTAAVLLLLPASDNHKLRYI